ncbi:neuropilin-2 [Sphaerodactylus townsendi]|uniref:neuropilin-2 n=1 Tax=Sphaerodactylus townsendi TaxID=933632 RepID=UPI002025C5E8|nr:neuropilin-2 [Sphaerodactylus townsendi]
MLRCLKRRRGSREPRKGRQAGRQARRRPQRNAPLRTALLPTPAAPPPAPGKAQGKDSREPRGGRGGCWKRGGKRPGCQPSPSPGAEGCCRCCCRRRLEPALPAAPERLVPARPSPGEQPPPPAHGSPTQEAGGPAAAAAAAAAGREREKRSPRSGGIAPPPPPNMDPLPGLWGLVWLLVAGRGVLGQAAPSCGGHLNSKDAGYITSPGYPQDYPSHQNCEWIIYAPEPSQKIILNFNPHFEIEKHDCNVEPNCLSQEFSWVPSITSDNPPDCLCLKIKLHDLILQGSRFAQDGKMLRITISPLVVESAVQLQAVSDGVKSSILPPRRKVGPIRLKRCFQMERNVWVADPQPNGDHNHLANPICNHAHLLWKQAEKVTETCLILALRVCKLRQSSGVRFQCLGLSPGKSHVQRFWKPSLVHLPGGRGFQEQSSRSPGSPCRGAYHPGQFTSSWEEELLGSSRRSRKEGNRCSANFQCNIPLGMESGRISNEQITASSTYSDGRWTPQQSRLNSDDNGWTPNMDNNREYLQVDLRFLTVLTAIATQGAISRETQNGYYVRSYKLEVSTNGEDWMMYRHGKNHKVFQANTDASEVVLNKLHAPVLTRFVRIRPQLWHSGIALRLELFGCRITELPAYKRCPHVESLTPNFEQKSATPSSRFLLGSHSSGVDPPLFSSCVSATYFQLPIGFNCNFDLPGDLCGWTHDASTGFTWTFHSRNTWTSHLGPGIGAYPDGKHHLRLQSSARREGQHARLVSPMVFSPRSTLCMVFRYQLSGGSGTTLQVWREAIHESKPLWIVREDQGDEWKEGRIRLRSYDTEYQIVFEGNIGEGHSGEIAIDDVRMGTDSSLENCMEPISAFPGDHTFGISVDFPRLEDGLSMHGEDFGEDASDDYLDLDKNGSLFPSNSPLTPKVDKEKSWLYTLDPILVTIIAMSSLGVLLGAICAGLLLYCTCSYTGLSSRSSTTLENYNFELYDGIKHKVKMNHQKCCSEA